MKNLKKEITTFEGNKLGVTVKQAAINAMRKCPVNAEFRHAKIKFGQIAMKIQEEKTLSEDEERMVYECSMAVMGTEDLTSFLNLSGLIKYFEQTEDKNDSNDSKG